LNATTFLNIVNESISIQKIDESGSLQDYVDDIWKYLNVSIRTPKSDLLYICEPIKNDLYHIYYKLGKFTSLPQFMEHLNKHIIMVLKNKSTQYSLENDVLSHFKNCSKKLNVPIIIPWIGMFSKHLESIDLIVNNKIPYSADLVLEKMIDAINYIFLFKGLCLDTK